MIAPVRDFTADNLWQAALRDRYLVHFYERFALKGRYVFIDKSTCSTLLQKQLAVDTVMQLTSRSVCIEEKIDRWGARTGNLALETQSWGKPGWMRYAQADYLLYAFTQPDSLLVHFIDFPRLKAWFWPIYKQFPERMIGQSNSLIRLVPAAVACAAVPSIKFICDNTGCHDVETSRLSVS